jgi:mannose-6-phosphate isomerase-like protein (cupin superfamily)
MGWFPHSACLAGARQKPVIVSHGKSANMDPNNSLMRHTPVSALNSLAAQTGATSVELFRHGSLVLKIYKPDKVDPQTPHSRDEAYVVLSGSGNFVKAGVSEAFQPGEFLFVPAGVEHRFEGFAGDFAAWVIFYGPEAGEAGKSS